jgi:ribosomal protein S26
MRRLQLPRVALAEAGAVTTASQRRREHGGATREARSCFVAVGCGAAAARTATLVRRAWPRRAPGTAAVAPTTAPRVVWAPRAATRRRAAFFVIPPPTLVRRAGRSPASAPFYYQPRPLVPAPQDKAVGRFMVRNMVDAGGLNDLKAASAYELYVLPKLYSKNYYCVSCAVHSRIVRVRNVEKRKNRDPPVRFRRTDADKKKA